jgi:hypothetical protein
MVLAAVLLVVLLNRDDGDEKKTASGTASSSTAPPTTSAEPAPDGGEPTVPGWRAYKTGASSLFDTPPSWTVTMETDDAGNQYPLAQYKQGVCGVPEQARGVAYTEGIQISDPYDAVTKVVQRTADAALAKGPPQITQGPVREISEGRYYTQATFTGPPAGSCLASTVVLHLVVAESTSGYTMLVVTGDQGVQDSPANEDLALIAKSFRYDAG